MRKFLIACSIFAFAACQSAKHPAEPAPRHDFKWVGYDDAKHVLSIQFNDGSRAAFDGVPEPTYLEMMRSPAKMSFFTNSIRGHFSSRPLD